MLIFKLRRNLSVVNTAPDYFCEEACDKAAALYMEPISCFVNDNSVACTINILRSSFDDCHEWCLYYEFSLGAYLMTQGA